VIFVHQPDRAGTVLRLQNSIANRVASHVRLLYLYLRLSARTSSARGEASGHSAKPRPAWRLPARLASTRGTTRVEATAATTPGARHLRPRFVHGQPSSTKLSIVQFRNGLLRVVITGHFDEGKAARTTGISIAHDGNRFDSARLSEELLQVLFVGFVGDVSDV
jgi:hypothetical protein